MTTALQLLVTGITIGSVYILLALGWVLVYRVSGLIFLVIGEFAVLGALETSQLLGAGWGLAAAIILAIVLALVVAGLLDFGLLRRLAHLDHMQSVLLMIGLALLFEELFRRIFGANVQLIPPFLPKKPLTLGGVAILPHQLLLVGVTAAFALALWLLLHRTVFGKALRACAENAVGAKVCGISPRLMRSISLAIAVVIAAVAGILLGPIQPMDPSSGLSLSTAGFIAAALGLWTLPGAVAAGLLLGCIGSFGAGYVSSAYQDVFAQGALVVALVLATLPWTPHVIRRRLDSA